MTDWDYTNLVYPWFLPLALLAIVYILPLQNVLKIRVSPWLSVRDGQLAWVALGMCLGAQYDLKHATVPDTGGLRATQDALALLGILGSAVVAVISPLYPAGELRDTTAAGLFLHYRVFWGTVVLTLGCAFLYRWIHLTT